MNRLDFERPVNLEIERDEAKKKGNLRGAKVFNDWAHSWCFDGYSDIMSEIKRLNSNNPTRAELEQRAQAYVKVMEEYQEYGIELVECIIANQQDKKGESQ